LESNSESNTPGGAQSAPDGARQPGEGGAR